MAPLPRLFLRHVALTQEHGSWVFLLSPLIIGIFAGGWQVASGWLVLAALGAFLIKQPITIAVKVYSGRRSREELPAAAFWSALYGLMALAGLAGLWRAGFGQLGILAPPALLVLGWHLWLVTQRAERHQIWMDVVASAALALACPAAYWVGRGSADAAGWWLWLLVWLQSAGSILYAALRLEQRRWTEQGTLRNRARAGLAALVWTGISLGVAAILPGAGVAAKGIWIAFSLQWAETLRGAWNPAVGARPAAIGLRQLGVSSLFTLVFILIWGM